jgi:hypothetical protein
MIDLLLSYIFDKKCLFTRVKIVSPNAIAPTLSAKSEMLNFDIAFF